MLVRFNESELGSLSFAYSNLNRCATLCIYSIFLNLYSYFLHIFRSELKPTYGSMKAKEIKQLRNGLVGMIMEAEWPAKFDRLVRFDGGSKAEGKSGASFPLKQEVFVGYEPKGHSSIVEPAAVDPLRIDPLRGPSDQRGSMLSPLYGDFNSNPVSPMQPPPQVASPDWFAKGDDIRLAASGLTEKFAALSTVSTIDSKTGFELFKNKPKGPNSPEQKYNQYAPQYQ